MLLIMDITIENETYILPILRIIIVFVYSQKVKLEYTSENANRGHQNLKSKTAAIVIKMIAIGYPRYKYFDLLNYVSYFTENVSMFLEMVHFTVKNKIQDDHH